MHDVCTYSIRVRGQVEEHVLNAASPLRVAVAQRDQDTTLFAVCADQSALLGLIRHLHGQGFVILDVHRER